MPVHLSAMQACVYRGKSFIDSRYYQMNYLFRGLSARHFYLLLSLLLLGWTPARADFLWFKQQQKAQVTPPSQLLGKQQPAVFNREVYDRMNAENISILVSLSRQRLLFRTIGGEEGCVRIRLSSSRLS